MRENEGFGGCRLALVQLVVLANEGRRREGEVFDARREVEEVSGGEGTSGI